MRVTPVAARLRRVLSATEGSEPPENRRAEPPDQIAELIRLVGEDPAKPFEFPTPKKAQPTTNRRRGSFHGAIGHDAAGAASIASSKSIQNQG